jgi:hypothetical protein
VKNERGKRSADYINNWSTFRAANESALPRLRITLGHSAQETPPIKAPTYVIDWSDNALLGKGTFGAVRKASSVATNEVFAAKIFKVRGDIQIELGFLQALRYVRVNQCSKLEITAKSSQETYRDLQRLHSTQRKRHPDNGTSRWRQPRG